MILIEGGSLNRFEAERHGAHALNSLVSALGERGMLISRQWENLQGHYGETRCLRYFIKPEDRGDALRIVRAGK